MVGRIRPPPCGRAETCWDERFCGCPFPPNGCGTTLHVPSNCLVHEGFSSLCDDVSRQCSKSLAARARMEEFSMSEAYIIDAVRTAIGKKGGALSATHPADLGAGVLTHLLERTEIDPHGVDDVIFGCVDAIGPQAGNIARTSWLAAGLPVEVPGVTVDRQCGSSQQAVHFAAQAVMSGTADLVVAGGVQNMSAIPIASAMTVGQQFGFETPFHGSIGWRRMYGDQEVSQVPRRGVDCSELADQSDRDGTVGVAEPRPGSIGDRERAVRERNRAGGRFSGRRMPTRDQSRGRWQLYRRCCPTALSPRPRRARSATERARSSWRRRLRWPVIP